MTIQHPIGFFWDIENCPVPGTKSAQDVVQRFRQKFGILGCETEFVVVCDVSKERRSLVDELNLAQVSVIHVSSISKNAADEKLKTMLYRFASVHSSQPATVILISSDINFSPVLNDLSSRHRFDVILVHQHHVSASLISCAKFHYLYHDVLNEVTLKDVSSQSQLQCRPSGIDKSLRITGIPKGVGASKIKERLQRITDNCGGKVLKLNRSSQSAVLSFPSPSDMARAKRRINRETIFGAKLTAQKVGEKRIRHLTGSDSSLSIERSPDPQEASNFLTTHEPQRPTCSKYGRSSDDESDTTESDNMRFSEMKNPNAQGVYRRQCYYQGRNAHKGAFSRVSTKPTDNFDSKVATQQADKQHYPVQLMTLDGPFLDKSGNNSSPAMVEDLGPIDLEVSNLDDRMHLKELKKVLYTSFDKYAKVLHVTVVPRSDGQCTAIIQVANVNDADTVVRHLNRSKIGSKRICVAPMASDRSSGGGSPQGFQLDYRQEAVSLLMMEPTKSMPLMKFLEIFQQKYGCCPSISQLYAMKDVIKITESFTGRTIKLQSHVNSGISPRDDGISNGVEVVHCQKHFSFHRTFSTFGNDTGLMTIQIAHSDFMTNVHKLLQSHNGNLTLLSFPDCYAAEVGSFPVSDEGSGVPLEHLLRTIPGVQLRVSDSSGLKVIHWEQQSHKAGVEGELEQLALELIEILAMEPGSCLRMEDLVFAYKHHFGREFNVKRYGDTHLVALLERLACTIEILGSGINKTLTLSHRVQMNRFTEHVLKLLYLYSEQIGATVDVSVTGAELKVLWEQYLNNQLRPTQYGMCFLGDLLQQLPANLFIVGEHTGDGTVVSLRQSLGAVAMDNTSLTIRDLHEDLRKLLGSSPRCRILLSQLSILYQQRFNVALRLADYGIGRDKTLLDVLEDCPNVQVFESSEGHVVTLKEEEMVLVLSDQVFQMLKAQQGEPVPVHQLMHLYWRFFGNKLYLSDYGCVDIEELLQKLGHILIVDNGAVPTVCLKEAGFGVSRMQPHDRDCEGAPVETWKEVLPSENVSRFEELEAPDAFTDKKRGMKEKLYVMFLERPNASIHWKQFQSEFWRAFKTSCANIDALRAEYGDIVDVHESRVGTYFVRLTPLQSLALKSRLSLLDVPKHEVQLYKLPGLYASRWSDKFSPQKYGFATLIGLIRGVSNVLYLKGRGNNANVCINKNFLCGFHDNALPILRHGGEKDELMGIRPVMNTKSELGSFGEFVSQSDGLPSYYSHREMSPGFNGNANGKAGDVTSPLVYLGKKKRNGKVKRVDSLDEEIDHRLASVKIGQDTPQKQLLSSSPDSSIGGKQRCRLAAKFPVLPNVSILSSD